MAEFECAFRTLLWSALPPAAEFGGRPGLLLVVPLAVLLSCWPGRVFATMKPCGQ